MRRDKTSLQISPTLLKHFAAATVAITICFALLADGGTTEAVKETVKHNERKRVEVDLLGARKLVNNNLKVAPTRSMPIEDPPLLEQDSGQSTVALPASKTPVLSGPKPLPAQFERPEDMLPGRQKVLNANKQARPRQLTAEDIAKFKEASRIRSGASIVE